MNDLISRQAAIDAISGWDWQDAYLPIHFKQVLEELPSAEPKITEKLELLEFLFNVIQPNDMEQYLLMYNKRGEKTDERSD